ncbi:dUTP diphosphatase [Nitrospina sp. 32_T5]|uniref:dUTP diphosphatase n=1 Tax=unclassified Nitrospina TaxID=2638683 RepID=UPI003F96D5D6
MTDLAATCRVQGEPLPVYTHPGDAGADLFAAADDVIPARSRKLIGTGIRIALPAGHAGLIWPRSGLAVKKGIDCGAGVIDSQYRGEVRVLLFNHSDEDVAVKKGDRIAQLLVQKVERVDFVPVEELDETARGANGFGSSG